MDEVNLNELPALVGQADAGITALTGPDVLPQRMKEAHARVWPDAGIRERLVPQSEFDKVDRAVKADHTREVAEALWDLGQYVHDERIAAAVAAEREVTRRAPNPHEAFRSLFPGYERERNPLLFAQIESLDLQRQQQWSGTLDTMPPSRVLALYHRVMLDGDDSTGTLARLIEQRVEAGRFPATDDPEDLTAVSTLKRQIAAVQDARVPDHVKAAEAALQRARARYAQFTALGWLPARRDEL